MPELNAPEPPEAAWRCPSRRAICTEDAFGNVEWHDGTTQVVCRRCYRRSNICFECGNRYTEENIVYTSRGVVCERCREENSYEECANCGETFHPRDDHDFSHDDPDDYDEYGSGEGLHSYDYRPRMIFHTGASGADDPFYLGIEVEMQSGGNLIGHGIDMVRDMTGGDESNLYCKRDGSIGDGMEVVSHPRTLRSWHEFTEFFDLMNALRKAGWRGWNTSEECGVHVHLSDTAFEDGERHLWAFQRLFYDNRKAIVNFSGRDSHWGKLDANEDQPLHWTRLKKGIDSSGWGLDRYMAVNLTNNKTTEIRVFRGTTRPERIMADIEFVHAACTYARDLTYEDVSSGIGTRWDVFSRWMHARPEYQFASMLNAQKNNALIGAFEE
jgi:hypothetical protein